MAKLTSQVKILIILSFIECVSENDHKKTEETYNN